jgi:hypothetical protein
VERYLVELDRTHIELLTFIVNEYEKDIYENDDGTLNKTKAISDIFTIKEAMFTARREVRFYDSE